ncbi:hypothetical protein DER44DRAFT_741722 [Fusarium oxysporum]|nr:hypothetical protein DER44DRAFT_741722 [Fusarium oxysporum]
MAVEATEISTPSPYELYLEQFDKSVRQEIAGRNMDPIKLLTMLRIKFSGAYEVQMMHNTYSIKAPRRLTTVRRNRSMSSNASIKQITQTPDILTVPLFRYLRGRRAIARPSDLLVFSLFVFLA